MEIFVILTVLFLGFSALVWTIMNISVAGYSRYETVFTEAAETRLERLFLFFDSRKIFIINLFSLLLFPVMIYMITDSVFFALLTVIGLFVIPKIAFRFLEVKRSQNINKALPDALAQIAGGMRAGSTLPSAMDTMVRETKGPISQEFSLVLREQRMGLSLEEALDNLGERVQSEEMDLVITAAQIAREVGGNLAEIFERLSRTLRQKLEMEGKIDALTAQGKLQGWVVGMLPFGIILAMFYVEPDAIQPIFHSLLGWVFLTVILVLEVLGGLVIRKIVAIDI